MREWLEENEYRQKRVYNTMLPIYQVILWMGAAQGVLLAALLCRTPRYPNQSHLPLASAIALLSIELIYQGLLQIEQLESIPPLLYLIDSIDFLYGPLLWLYVLRLTSNTGLSRNRLVIHVLPFALCYIFILPSILASPEHLASVAYEQQPPLAPIQWSVQNQWLNIQLVISRDVLAFHASLLHIAIYLGLCIWQLRLHDRQIRDQCSNIEWINLAWLRRILILCLLLYLTHALDNLTSLFDPLENWVGNLSNVFIVGLIYSLGYLSLRHPLLFPLMQEATPPMEENKTEPPKQEDLGEEKYRKSPLNEETVALLAKDIQIYCQQERPYLEANLTLSALAQRLEVTPNYLSQTLNQHFAQNFFDFINAQRVTRAKQLLSDPEQNDKTILEVAYESGFNSKSAFYAAFKKHQNQTPSAFRTASLASKNS